MLAKPTKEPLSFAQVAKRPRPGIQSIGSVCFTPDDHQVLYLRSAEYGSMSRQLFATNISTGAEQELACTPPVEEAELSLEEKMRRERARMMNTGVTSFKVGGKADQSCRILVPMSGTLYVRDGLSSDSELQRLFDPEAPPLGPGPVLDAQISEDGSVVCFVWSDEVYCVPSDGSAPPKAVTTGARGTGKTHGVADFLAQEELDRYEGFWVSPDGKQLAFEEVDETHIPHFRIMHHGDSPVGEGAEEQHRYPFAGAANPKVKLFVVPTSGQDADAAGGEPPAPTFFDLSGPFGEDFYLAAVKWLTDGTLVVQVLSRDQMDIAVLQLFPASGEIRQLFSEHSDTWINVHHVLRPVGEAGKLLWASERTGFRHLYIYDPAHPEDLQQVTGGDWQVDDVVAVDDKAGVVYFMGTTDGGWLERHLYSASLEGTDGKTPKQITTEPGMHYVFADHQCKTFVDVSNAADRPATALLRSLADGKVLASIYKNKDPLIADLDLVPPKFAVLPSTDGKETLQAAIYQPDPAIYGPGPYPTMVYCYGGPHVQLVQNSWALTVDLQAKAMVDRGILVLKVDNRGSARRGLAFEGALKHRMGTVEVDDQVAGVKWCIDKGLTIPSKVGITGWSYGGYLSAMCLAKAPDVFRCAVSGAPVTSWDGYDTCYTERYMATPQSNPDGYSKGSVIDQVAGMSGDLLLVHGLVDENVHFRHTARLITAMIGAQKSYRLLLFPGERHSPRSLKDREYMEREIMHFIQASFGAVGGPAASSDTTANGTSSRL